MAPSALDPALSRDNARVMGGLTINAYLQRLRCGICRGHVAVAALQRQRRGREVEVIGLRGKGLWRRIRNRP
jgi:hypothetical protein